MVAITRRLLMFGLNELANSATFDKVSNISFHTIPIVHPFHIGVHLARAGMDGKLRTMSIV